MPEKKFRTIIKLPPEQKTKLEAAKEDIEKAEHAIAVLEKLGIDTTEIKAKLEWAKIARETILREFG